MKTPIQKLIEELEMMRDESDGHTAEVHAYTKAIELAESFLKDEADALDLARKTGLGTTPIYYFKNGKAKNASFQLIRELQLIKEKECTP
jgi:acyl-CoA synthetase (NDP forming)